MRFPKPPNPNRTLDPRNDPSVTELDDGSLMQYDEKTGRWSRIYTPERAPYAPQKAHQSTPVDWGLIIYGILVLLALYGLVSLVVGLSNHSIDCHLGTTQGCYITIPSRGTP